PRSFSSPAASHRKYPPACLRPCAPPIRPSTADLCTGAAHVLIRPPRADTHPSTASRDSGFSSVFASFAAVLTTHADGSSPFDSTPRGDHFEPSPTHFSQGSGDRLPLLVANYRSSSSLRRSCDRHHHHQNSQMQ
ncbi:hypothetical protein Salat_0651600, partial [Sesamum alatum]